jgi:RNA polymerase sigma-70 factor (sigma-E family)
MVEPLTWAGKALQQTRPPCCHLIVEVLARREVGFGGFVRQNTPTLLRTAYLLTGNAQQAEELVRDTRVKLHPTWERVEQANVPLAYVRRSLTNGYIKQRRRAVLREIADEDVPERVEPFDAVQQLADRDQIWAGLRHLSERQRAALVLRFFDDMSDKETAAALGCRVGTMRSLITSGLAKLLANMAEAYGRE